MQSHVGSAVLTLIDTRLSFCILLRIQKVSGDLHYLLAKRSVNILCLFSLMNVNQPKKLIFLWSVFSLICITLKVLIKLHSYRTKVQLVTTKYLTQRSNVADASATTCFFYIPTISTNKSYENLAVSIGSTMKPLTSSILMISNSSKGSTFLQCFKLPVPLVVWRL